MKPATAFFILLVVLVACGGHVAYQPTLGASGMAAGIRLIAPLSTTTVTSQRPTLRWVLGDAEDGAQIDLCRTRECTGDVVTFVVHGSRGAPPNALGAGVYFWRAHSIRDGVANTVATPTWEFWIGARSAPVDTSWGTTLDVNGDGLPDLALGNTYAGRAYVYLGSPTGFAASATTTLSGPKGFGQWVASAGDLDGDGFGDFIVGMKRASTSDPVAYVYAGGPSGLATSPSMTFATNAVQNDTAAAAGDVNGDGFGDLVVGESDDTTSAATVYFGSATGLSPTSTTKIAGPPGVEISGALVASAGDMNGDGFADVIVAAAAREVNGVGGRPVYLYLGGASGPSATTMTKLMDGQGEGIELDTTAAPPCAADFNGDGYSDVVMYEDDFVYVFVGRDAGPTSKPTALVDGMRPAAFTPLAGADVNADGYVDLVIGTISPVDAVAGRVYVYLGGAMGLASTPATLDGLDKGFGFSLSSAGDVDGDGFADVVIGDPSSSSAYVYRGGSTGLASTPSATLTSPDPIDGFGPSVALAVGIEPSRPRAI